MHTVLLVDDERWVRTSLKKVIERTELPFTVVQEATDGLAALDWLKEHSVDLVVTDVCMPVMDGLQLARSLYEQAAPPEIVIVSGHNEFGYAQQALRSGVVDYLLKPVMVEDMAACLKQVEHQIGRNKQERGDVEKPQDELELSTVELVMEYIKGKLPGEVTLQEAAAYVHLNPSYLSHLFKQQTKVNFMDFVLKQRMEEAKRLLSTTSLRISEMALRLGYTDISYFSNTFKRIIGQTPSDFRKDKKK